MLESQEGERLRFSLSTLGPIECREPPESDQPCLLFVQLQPILAQMLLQFPEVALCLVLDGANFGAMNAAIRSATSAIVSRVVSIEMAPAGRENGAVFLDESIRSRSVTLSTRPSFSRRRSRSADSAWRKKRKSASGKITDPMSRPSMTSPRNPPFLAAAVCPR